MQMVWHDLAFLHWRVEAQRLRSHLPRGLELDTFDGSAWLGIVPFRMSGIRPYGLPLHEKWGGAFPELNVRTYATAEGKPGVWFFSLDAASRLAVRAARRWFHLPYFDADMDCAVEDEGIRYRSVRTHRKAAAWTFRARYRPTGPVERAVPGSLEAFLVERYCLYAADRNGVVYRGDIMHDPWPLQTAEAEIEVCEWSDPFPMSDLQGAPLIHFARYLKVSAWTLERCGPGSAAKPS